ncbi:hypothetical protein GCM10028818_40900 [Spirosoma horti]
MTETIFDNWGRSFVLPGVYSDFAPFCRLVHIATDGTRTPFDLEEEPIGWSSAKFTLKRGDMHGVNHEYTTSETALEFNNFSGRDFVESIFRAEGEDADLLFQAGIVVPAIPGPAGVGVDGFEVIEYEGRLNLSTRKTSQRRVTGALERNTLQSRVLARWETAVNLSTSRTLDGAQITPPTFQSIPLTAQSLDERFTCNVTGGKSVEQSFQGDTNGHLWVQFDTSQPQVSEIEEFAGGRPMGLSESDGPMVNDEWLFKFKSSGIRTVTVEVGYQLGFSVKKRTVSIGAAKVTGYQQNTRLTLVRADGSKQDWDITTPQAEGQGKRPPRGDYREADVLIVSAGKLSLDIDTKPGDKLFLYGFLSFTHNKNELQQTAVRLKVTTTRITVSGKSTNSATSARCLPVGDALNQALTVITGKTDRFRSNYYGLASDRYPVDGCGARRVLLNGFAIRQFKPLERPLTISMQDTVESLSVIDCMGVAFGYELDDTGTPVEIVRMEPVQEFYRPVELLRLDEVSDYKEETIASEIYSTVEVGYQQWAEDGAGSLEEMFTTHQVTTPIRHESAKKPLTSKLIASSLAIEQTRREQFTDTPKDSTSFDEKAFIVQCKPIPAYSGIVTFVRGFLYSIVEVPTVISWLTVGQSITISGSVQNSGTYRVTFISDASKRPWTFYVAEDIVDETVMVAGIAPAAGGLSLQPETGADFDTVTGLVSPGDTLNLRLSPGRMLLQNAPVWAGCLINKDKFNAINKQPLTETGLIGVGFAQVAFFNEVITNIYVPWLAAGMTVQISGDTTNVGTFTVLAVAAPDYQPWAFFVKEQLTPGSGNAVNISFGSISTDDLYAAVNKTKIPNNKSVVTVLPPGDSCGKAGRVSESAPVAVDELIDDLLYLPRLIKFSVRLSHQQTQRLRLGHTGQLPPETDDNGDPVNANYGYISLLNESGIRVAGFLSSVEYSRDDEKAIFELRQTALDLGDTTSGLDCGQFAGWTLEQAQAADERTRRRIELCRFIDVDPL